MPSVRVRSRGQEASRSAAASRAVVSSGPTHSSLEEQYRHRVRGEIPAAAAISSAVVAATPWAAKRRTASRAISSRVAALRR